MQAFNQHITIDPNIRSGKHCVKGTRITVFDVLGYLSQGMSWEEIIHDFPELTEENIKACLLFTAEKEQKIRIV